MEDILDIKRRNEWKWGWQRATITQRPWTRADRVGGRQLHIGRQKAPFAAIEEVHYLTSCSSSFESIYWRPGCTRHCTCVGLSTPRITNKDVRVKACTEKTRHLCYPWLFTRAHPSASSPEASLRCFLFLAAPCHGGHFRALCWRWGWWWCYWLQDEVGFAWGTHKLNLTQATGGDRKGRGGKDSELPQILQLAPFVQGSAARGQSHNHVLFPSTPTQGSSLWLKLQDLWAVGGRGWRYSAPNTDLSCYCKLPIPDPCSRVRTAHC